MNDEAAFLQLLLENEDDATTRLVYADWLDEHDRPEDADRQRQWPASKKWLTEFTRDINYAEYLRDAAGDLALDPETGHRVEDPATSRAGPHTLADVIEAGREAVAGGWYSFRTDEGADYFRDTLEKRQEFFRHWAVYTGVPVPEAVVADPPFSCSC